VAGRERSHARNTNCDASAVPRARYVRLTADHRPPERPPIRLTAGERVSTGNLDPTWPAFRWCVNTDGDGGWIPDRYLKRVSNRVAVAAREYDTTELATSAGDVLRVLEADDESGWLWCADRAGREGWVPAASVEEI
jgi:Variant SH3 domain